MQITPRDLEVAIENSKEYNQKNINLLKVLEALSISPRDLYYESEAKFILDNLGLYVDSAEELAIAGILNSNEGLNIKIIDEIVELTTNYESPANNEDFIADALSIIRHFINTARESLYMDDERCIIENKKMNWVMTVDNNEFIFQGQDFAEHLKEKYKQLGYNVTLNDNTRKRD